MSDSEHYRQLAEATNNGDVFAAVEWMGLQGEGRARRIYIGSRKGPNDMGVMPVLVSVLAHPLCAQIETPTPAPRLELPVARVGEILPALLYVYLQGDKVPMRDWVVSDLQVGASIDGDTATIAFLPPGGCVKQLDPIVCRDVVSDLAFALLAVVPPNHVVFTALAERHIDGKLLQALADLEHGE